LALITVFIIPFGAYFTDSYFGGVLVIGFWLAGVAEILSVLKKIVKWMKSDNRKWKWRKKFLIEGSMNIEVWEEVWRYVKANNGDFEYFFAEIFGKLIKRELRKKRGDTDIFRCLLKSARYSVVEEYLYRLLIEDINDFPPESRVALSLRRMIQNMIITDLSNEGYLLSLYLPGNSDFNKLSGNKLENYKKVIEEIKKTTKITRKGSKNRLFILHEGIKESGQTQQ
jgi:hypothetical protein